MRLETAESAQMSQCLWKLPLLQRESQKKTGYQQAFQEPAEKTLLPSPHCRERLLMQCPSLAQLLLQMRDRLLRWS